MVEQYNNNNKYIEKNKHDAIFEDIRLHLCHSHAI